jgi:hypothetical protein
MASSLYPPNDCYRGSTDFYDSPDRDEFTPSYLEARPLKDNVGQRSDGTPIPWIDPKSHKSPVEQYVEWFNGIWHTGDPSSWDETVFTNLAVMIDPTGISTGAKQAASNFLLLFEYYPDLRGEVVSWSANEREIFINWRFAVKRQDSKQPLLVPVIDKFCFADGRVSFRLAFFDVLTLMGYLSENYGQDRLLDFISANSRQAGKTGGIQFLPRTIWNLFKGLFLWPRVKGLTSVSAEPQAGVVNVKWEPVKEAVGYTVCRAPAVSGPYDPIAEVSQDHFGYEDSAVKDGEAYWYYVKPKFAKWRPVAVGSGHSPSDPPTRHKKLAYG